MRALDGGRDKGMVAARDTGGNESPVLSLVHACMYTLETVPAAVMGQRLRVGSNALGEIKNVDQAKQKE